MKIILASGSPRRKEILTKYGYEFDVIVPNIDESMKKELTPYENVMDVSFKKASEIFKSNENRYVLACDTIVTLDGVIYGKPKSASDAYNMIKTFSGKTHEVVSGVALIGPNYKKNFYVSSYVTFKELTDKEINDYIKTDEPYDKAGSYAIQGLGKALISKYEGSLYNIIGLPIEDLKKYLDLLGE